MLLDQDDWKDPKWTALYHTVGKMNNTTESRVSVLSAPWNQCAERTETSMK